jgi:hypothetical protein
VLVYGDAKRREEPGAKVERLRSGLAELGDLRPGIERHGALAGLLVEAGELEQAALDERYAQEGRDEQSPVTEALAAWTRRLAEVLLASFRSRGTSLLDRETVEVPDLPDVLAVSVPEGYVLYGLYPEAYLRAAEELRRSWQGALRVLGIRSIGTSLAAAVSAAGQAELTASVRPGGHPFARTLEIGGGLAQKLLSGGSTLFAIVDEGPGFSGSSFGCVADWLEDRGVPEEAIVFFPSHRGTLGPHASERHRSRWARARRCTMDFEELFIAPGNPWPLESWFEDLTGPAEAPLEDLGAGRWRDRFFPPAHLQQERRKYLLTAGGKRWLLKFAGLGRYGREKLELAEALQSAGFIPPISGLRHGFLAGPWLDDARPLPLVPDLDRAALLDRVADYLAFRAKRFPAGLDRRGASPEKLLEMMEFNASQVLGEEAARLRAWRQRLPELASLERPVLTDNRMHAWEWLVTPEGKILKADALDHHAGNDLVGAQDPAWDLAGAAVELAMNEEELGGFLEALERRGLRTAAIQFPFYLHAYLAFQIGWHELAAQALEGMDPEEAERMRRAGARYVERLRREL